MTDQLLALVPDRPDVRPIAELTMVRAEGYVLAYARGRRRFGARLSRRALLLESAHRVALLEKLLPVGPVIPLMPGTTLDPSGAAAFVRANRPVIDAAAAYLVGRSQYQLTVAWDTAAALSALGPRLIPEARDDAPDADALARAFARRTEAELGPIAIDPVALPRPTDMAVNTVFLVEDRDRAALDRAVEALDAIWSAGLRIRLTGPGPAMALCALAVRPVARSALARARRILDAPRDAGPERLEAARKAALRHGADPAGVRAAAAILAAAARVGPGTDTVVLAERWSEGRAQIATESRAA